MPTNADLARRRTAAIPRGVGNLLQVYAEHASNAEIWDVEGRRYIDFASGIAVLNTGHLHPRVQAAVAAQLAKLSHTCFQVTPYENYVALAERLNEIVPGSGPKKTIFLTTGAEAIENAVKIARHHTQRSAVIAFSGAFHGRTLACMSLTGKVQPYKAGFGAMLPDVYHAPFPVEYHGVSVAQSLAALQQLFKSSVDPSRVAAILIEPIQGEGGFYVAPPEFLRALRALCDQHGIVLIVDEIQTGFARTGRMFAYYGYFGRARAEQLSAIETRVREIEMLDASLETEQERILRLEQAQRGEVSRLEKARSERGEVLASLTAESMARSASLQRLQREQATLEKLLRELRRTAPKFPTDNRSPFANMRGKLAWPASGRLVARFGQQRAGTVKWEGVLISAPRGTPVRAIHRGRVVYADWLAGLGLLLIIDHGGGYLSLYGHNEQLFRAVGDQVVAGDTIAGVGDTGGRAQPELYFEIRQSARPLDPAPWFKDRQP